MAKKTKVEPNQSEVTQRIFDPAGPYDVIYQLPGPKIKIQLPGTEHIIILGPVKQGEACPITIVNPRGLATPIPVYRDEDELMRNAG
jgi:hypothetical protein